MDSSLWAVDVAITDKSGQSITLKEVVFAENRPELVLKLSTPGSGNSDDVELTLNAAMLKEITRDNTARGESYQVRVVVTLIDGHQYRGEVTGAVAGESDLGKAKVDFSKLTRAAFTRAAGDADYVPAAGPVRSHVTDKAGNQFEITKATATAGNRDRGEHLACTLGEISLSVPLENIAKIENTGEAKLEYSTGAKLRLTLVSGRTLDVTAGPGNTLAGPFKYGQVAVPLGAMANAALEKKK